MENKKIKIYWMHCKSCELILENNLKDIDWIEIKKIDSKKWILDIDIKNKELLEDIENQIIKSGFSLENKQVKKNNINDYFSIIIITLIVLIIYMFIRNFELFSFLRNFKEISIWVAIITWIVASLSSCLAVTWGIIIWFSKYLDSSKWILSHIKVQWSFHIWRILWFSIMWWLLGIFGWFLWFSVWTYDVLLILAWIVMLYMWLNILNIVPSITNLWVSMPKTLSKKILNIKNPVFAPLVWALTFFLPCWFTQSMQIVAVSSWSFLNWMIIMWAFALWTFPVLFLVWIWSSYINDKKLDIFNKIIWVIIISFAIFILNWAWNLMSFSNNNSSSNKEIVTTENSESEDINVWHNGYSTIPEKILLKSWHNYKLTITPNHDWIWCMTTLVIPQISNELHTIKKWLPIVYNLTNLKKWTYKIVCWTMWMHQWEIEVE